MISDLKLLDELRILLGAPTETNVPNRRLKSHLQSGLELLAQHFGYRTETVSVTLTEDEPEYPLPEDCQRLIWATFNGAYLDAASVPQWVRDQVKYQRDEATSGTPGQFAVESRKLILYPPPSDDSLDSATEVVLHYISDAPLLEGAHQPQLGEADWRLAVYAAAVEYCAANPTDENQRRAAGLERQMLLRWPKGKARAENPVEPYHPRAQVHTGRRGAAR